LKEIFRSGLTEYPQSGNINDVYSVTGEGIRIFVEIAWTPSKSNFLRDLNILHRSTADVKIFIVNPKILQKPTLIREYIKTQNSEREKGSTVSDMIDGSLILNNSDFANGEFVQTIKKLVAAQKARSFSKRKPEEKLKHSKLYS